MAIQWFPGHMNSTKKAIVERLPDIDAVIELLDARLPGSSSNPLLAELTALLGHAFGDLGLRRIEADIDPRNHASIQVIEKAGFQREGVLRERYIYNGEIQDVVYYGLLAREFGTSVAR